VDDVKDQKLVETNFHSMRAIKTPLQVVGTLPRKSRRGD
jgi:hypothetical protein